MFSSSGEGTQFKITLPHKEKLADVENSMNLISGVFLDNLRRFFEESMSITVFEENRLKNEDIGPRLREFGAVIDIDCGNLYNVILTADF